MAGSAVAPDPCPLCGSRRRNATDVREGYCPRCCWFTFDPVLLEAWCRDYPEKVQQALVFREQMNLQCADVFWVF